MKYLITLFLFCLYSYSYSNDTLKKMVQYRLNHFIDKKGQLTGFYKIDEKGISVFSSPSTKKANDPECLIYWDEVTKFQKLLKDLPTDSTFKIYASKKSGKLKYTSSADNSIQRPGGMLNGYKIAIDPGHIAGDNTIAAYEQKCLMLKKDSVCGIDKPIELIEGNLTLATAYLLKDLLEKEGAEIMMTRSEQNQTASGLSFNDWYKKNYKGKVSPKEAFQKHLKNSDLIERANKINGYNPDFTVIIHYNVDEKNVPWTGVTNKNYCMTFIGGNIKGEYMSKQLNRYHLLRMMLSDDLDQSARLSAHVTNAMSKNLQIPMATENDAEYLFKESQKTIYKGVFIRNLVLTRLIDGPLVYGESLYQDNKLECKMLSNCPLNVHGIPTSKRVQQVAQSYFDGILEYVKPFSN